MDVEVLIAFGGYVHLVDVFYLDGVKGLLVGYGVPGDQGV